MRRRFLSLLVYERTHNAKVNSFDRVKLQKYRFGTSKWIKCLSTYSWLCWNVRKKSKICFTSIKQCKPIKFTQKGNKSCLNLFQPKVLSQSNLYNQLPLPRTKFAPFPGTCIQTSHMMSKNIGSKSESVFYFSKSKSEESKMHRSKVQENCLSRRFYNTYKRTKASRKNHNKK